MRLIEDNITLLGLITICCLVLLPLIVYPQEQTNQSVQDKLTAAEELYYEGVFDKALILIHACLQDKAIQEAERKSAYKLLANIQLSQENRAAAETGIRNLLAIDPGYMPTIEQETPQFIALVKEVKAKIKQEQTKKKTWLWIGAGAATAAAVAATYFIIQGGDNGSREEVDERPLALPPDWPD
jgi:hypothetical protein